MFTLDSEAAMLKAFRPKDRAAVELSPNVKLPALVRHYLTWAHPAGGRQYLVFSSPGGVPTGIVFDTNGGGVASEPSMCDWCHHSGAGNEVGLLTATLNSHKRLGMHVCVDLSCQQKIEDEANRTGRSATDALEKLVSRMARFASEALKIDLSGVGR